MPDKPLVLCAVLESRCDQWPACPCGKADVDPRTVAAGQEQERAAISRRLDGAVAEQGGGNYTPSKRGSK